MKLIPQSSLYKPFSDTLPQSPLEHAYALSNEPLSLQFVCLYDDAPDNTCDAYVSLTTELPYELYEVRSVPVLRPTYAAYDSDYERTEPGLYPDPLAELRPDGRVRLSRNAAKSFWVILDPKRESLAPGEYSVTFEVTFGGSRVSATVGVTILDAALAPQRLLYTNWFHCDCLCDYYGCEMFDERHMQLIAKYIATASRNGMNMLLLPCFTPPLDTPVGGERRTAQLVDVTKEGDGYVFGFERLCAFIEMCRANGIEYFEHSHLFSQWGAEHAPKIVDTKGERLFGWDTDAIAENGEYSRFLRQYLTELTALLEKLGISDRMYFHISDEPSQAQLENYRRAASLVKPYIGDCPIFEAISSYEFYKSGLVDIPIPVTTHAAPFIGNVENLWVYYTGGQSSGGLSNRLISMPNVRNRMLGVQLWYNDIKGFLQWGYNFWYTRLSEMPYDPWSSPDALEYFVGGTSFMVYPGSDAPTMSMRLLSFAEGLDDFRALDAYAELVGRERARELVREHFGEVTLYTCPTREQFEAFKSALCCAIVRASSR